MTTGQLTAVLGHFHQLVASSRTDLTDGQLLEAYVTRNDAAAFAALVRRHGPLVLNICRSVLHNEHDAEDAFQAAFLILARKASSIRRSTSVGGWLCKVTANVALKARARRRPHLDRQVSDVQHADPLASLARQELCQALADELQHLPEKYRLPLVLCYLEGLTTGEAARRLNWPTGTVKVRLMRARELLRNRLAQRGFSLSAGGLVSLLLLQPATAAVPAALAQTAVGLATLVSQGGAATAAGVAGPVVLLADAALPSFPLTSFKAVLSGLLVVALLAAATGGLIHRSATASGAPRTERPCQPALTREVTPPPADSRQRTDRPTRMSLATVSLFQHDSPINLLAVSPDGRQVAGAGQNGRIAVWDRGTGKTLTRVQAFEPVKLLGDETGHAARPPQRSLAGLLFPDDRTLAACVVDAAGTAEFICWDATTGQEKGALTDGNQMAQLLELASSVAQHRFQDRIRSPIPRPRDRLIVSPNGRYATAGGSWNGTLPLWEMSTGRDLRSLSVSAGLIHSVVFSPNGQKLAAAAADESLRVVETSTGQMLLILERPQGEAGLTTLIFAPDGQTILSGGTDGSVCCWPLP